MLLLRLPRGMAEKEIVAETGYFSLTIFRRPFRRTSGDWSCNCRARHSRIRSTA